MVLLSILTIIEEEFKEVADGYQTETYHKGHE